MKFRYKKLRQGLLRPIIPVGVSYRGKTITQEVLIDSGADICIFDAEIGEAIGIDIESGEVHEVGGVTGEKQPYFSHVVTMTVGGWPYTIEVGFSRHLAKMGHGLVGQKGFFEQFKVQFDLQKEEIELKPHQMVE